MDASGSRTDTGVGGVRLIGVSGKRNDAVKTIAMLFAAVMLSATPVAHSSAPDRYFGMGGATGWVSADYLTAHPRAIPGVRLVDGRLYTEAKGAQRCDGLTCVIIEGDSVFVDKFGTVYYSDGSEGEKTAYFQWWYATWIPGQGLPCANIKR